jgi:hypothetical protein
LAGVSVSPDQALTHSHSHSSRAAVHTSCGRPDGPPDTEHEEGETSRHERAATDHAAGNASAASDRARLLRLLRPRDSQSGRGGVEARACGRAAAGGGAADDGRRARYYVALPHGSPGRRRGGARRVQEAGAAGLQPAAQLGL